MPLSTIIPLHLFSNLPNSENILFLFFTDYLFNKYLLSIYFMPSTEICIHFYMYIKDISNYYYLAIILYMS